MERETNEMNHTAVPHIIDVLLFSNLTTSKQNVDEEEERVSFQIRKRSSLLTPAKRSRDDLLADVEKQLSSQSLQSPTSGGARLSKRRQKSFLESILRLP